MKSLVIIPFYKSFEAINNSFLRMLGRKAYVNILVNEYEEVGDIVFITDIKQLYELLKDDNRTNVSSILSSFEEKLDSLIRISIHNVNNYDRIIIANPNALPIYGELSINDFSNNQILIYIEDSTESDSNIIQKSNQMDFFLCSLILIAYYPNGNNFFSSSKLVSVNRISSEQFFILKTVDDWIIADRKLSKKRVVYRVNGYTELGLGHIYNCITLAYSLYEHDNLIVLNDFSSEGIRKVEEAGINYRVIHDDSEIDTVIDEYKPDVWVNDWLDTDAEYIRHLKSKIKRVITTEDLGSGASEADAVINALYDDEMLSGQNVYSGWKYVCLRDEFQTESRAVFSSRVKNVLIMFGGTDPSNYNRRIYPIIEQMASHYGDIRFEFIVGIGYDAESNGIITQEDKNIYVHSNVQRVTRYMKHADIAITSQGRTIFELAAMGVPSIVLSQNKRETTHKFAQMENGFLNLGTEEDISSELIHNTLDWLIKTPVIRKNMYDLMGKLPLRTGLQRVKSIILDDIGME